MMMPRSLTAVVHVTFNYGDGGRPKPASEPEIEMLSRILNNASDLSSEEQEILVKFADYLNQLKEDKGSPAS